MNELLALRELHKQVRRLRMTPPVDDDFGEVLSGMYAAHDAASRLLELDEISFDLVGHLRRQRDFSQNAFGPGRRKKGIIDHIKKELIEVEESDSELEEWIDVVLLALDGAWRSGSSPVDVAMAINSKQLKNENRNWPDWRSADPDKAIEHVRPQSDSDGTDYC